MSRQATDWAWLTKLRGLEKLVLLALAHRANAEGVCWPSVGRIADDCGLSVRTVAGALNALVSGGLVTREASKGGRARTNFFRLLAPVGALKLPMGVCEDASCEDETPQDMRGMDNETPQDMRGFQKITPQEMHGLSEAAAETPQDVQGLGRNMPETPQETPTNQVRKKEKKEEKILALSQADEAVAIWNQLTADRLPAVRLLTDFRRKMIDDRIADTLQGSIDQWRGFIQVVIASDFLAGRADKWSASFDWCVKRSNMIKILEGNYANRVKAKVASRWDIDDCLLGDNPFDSDPFAAVGASNVGLNRFH